MSLDDTFARHNGISFLFPDGLRRTGTSIRRLLVIGSCMAEVYRAVPALGWESDFIFANNAASLPETPPLPITDYDFQLIQIPMRSILPDQAHWSLGFGDVVGHERLYRDCCERISIFMDSVMKWNKSYGILTFVSNFLVPIQNPLGRLMDRYDLRNPVFFVERLNEFLYRSVKEHQNAHILDVDKVSASLGRGRTQEDSVGWMSHGAMFPVIPPDLTRIEPARASQDYYDARPIDFIKAVWFELECAYRTIRQIDQVKLIVVDLDDTLWSGVAGDQLNVGNHMMDDAIWPMGILEALAFLKKRGVLLGVISKNDEERVRSFWPSIVGNRLSLDDFAVVKINWRTKVENMSEILAAVNLLPRSVVFVDDNPVERAGMAAAFPDMRILDGYHYYWKRTLLWSSETQVESISDESTRRTEMVRAQVNRENVRASVSREQFLQNLNLSVRLFKISDEDTVQSLRVFELLNKTNQFNTTGKRWTKQQLMDARTDGLEIYAFDAEDRFTAYGIVGAVLINRDCIEQLVMSCRIAGLEVETAVLSILIEHLRLKGCSTVYGKIVATDANYLCRKIFEVSGFLQTNDSWMLHECVELAVPCHVKIDAKLG